MSIKARKTVRKTIYVRPSGESISSEPFLYRNPYSVGQKIRIDGADYKVSGTNYTGPNDEVTLRRTCKHDREHNEC